MVSLFQQLLKRGFFMFSTRFIAATKEYSTLEKRVPAPYLRRTFEVSGAVKTAKLTVLRTVYQRQATDEGADRAVCLQPGRYSVLRRIRRNGGAARGQKRARAAAGQRHAQLPRRTDLGSAADAVSQRAQGSACAANRNGERRKNLHRGGRSVPLRPFAHPLRRSARRRMVRRAPRNSRLEPA